MVEIELSLSWRGSVSEQQPAFLSDHHQEQTVDQPQQRMMQFAGSDGIAGDRGSETFVSREEARANQQDHLDRLKQMTALFIAPPQAKSPSQAVLTQIQSALVQRRVLALEYRANGRDDVTRREIEPLGLVYYSDHWHLIAYCRLRRDYRDFRTDRILKLSVRGDTFPPHAKFSVREYVTSWCDKTQGIEVKVKFSARATERARRSWFAGLISERRVSDGVIMAFPVGQLEWVTGWLLSFGTEAEVIAPVELRELLAEAALKLARHHSAGEEMATERNFVAASLLT